MTLVLLAVVAAAALVVAPFAGPEWLGWDAVFGGDAVFWNLRVPRVLVGFLAGVGLALGGMVFQALFRNPLATPFTLGVASGAALGTAVYVRLGLTFSLLGLSGGTFAAFGGALVAVGLVYGLTRSQRGFSTTTMLLAGVAASFVFSSLNLFVQYVSDFTQSFRIIRWIMGGIQVVGYAPVLQVAPFVLVGVLVAWYLVHDLNLMAVGDDIAMGRGVDVPRVRRVVFLVVSFMIAGIVAICGPVGFVGMMAPHIGRQLVGSEHRALLPATALIGGSLLTVCDTVGRTVIAPVEVPVGVVTALLGGPFFLWLLVGGVRPRKAARHR